MSQVSMQTRQTTEIQVVMGSNFQNEVCITQKEETVMVVESLSSNFNSQQLAGNLSLMLNSGNSHVRRGLPRISVTSVEISNPVHAYSSFQRNLIGFPQESGTNVTTGSFRGRGRGRGSRALENSNQSSGARRSRNETRNSGSTGNNHDKTDPQESRTHVITGGSRGARGRKGGSRGGKVARAPPM